MVFELERSEKEDAIMCVDKVMWEIFQITECESDLKINL